MERAGFMTCTAANHQGAIKEPAASLFLACEAHPVPTASFFGPTKTLGQSGPAGARGVVMNKGGVSQRQYRGSFHKVNSYNNSIKDF